MSDNRANRRDRLHWSERVPVGNAGAVQPRQPKSHYSRQLLDETIEVWQPYYETKLTDEDAREIIENTAAFFGALGGWRRDLQYRAEPSLDADREGSSDGRSSQ